MEKGAKMEVAVAYPEKTQSSLLFIKTYIVAPH